ncbi:hypothetical protein ACFFYR_28875 [Paraburkholderia dipogonis]|uniref:hypothetical protein n=1 Tax=Paraburkholderia dipogonis TaxID=1211383 RepID=UPI00141A92BF|nr:hypothetical protein [Paraburkholderia dipogonis]
MFSFGVEIELSVHHGGNLQRALAIIELPAKQGVGMQLTAIADMLNIAAHRLRAA